MPQIALVSDEHDDDVGIGVVPQLLQPPCDIFVGLVLADIVDEKSADGAAIVGRGDGAIPLLARRVPDLRLYSLRVDLDRSRRELDANSRLGIEIEFVTSESAEKVGLSDTRVSDENHFEGGVKVSWGGDARIKEMLKKVFSAPLKRNWKQVVVSDGRWQMG